MLAVIRDFLATGKALVGALLAPPFCENCYRAVQRDQIFCQLCTTKINLIAPYELKVTPRYHVRVLAISDYAAPLQKLILAKNGHNSLASRQLAELIWQYTGFRYRSNDYLIPIPLHWTRRLKRGFNQTEILAQRLVALAQMTADSGGGRALVSSSRANNSKTQIADILQRAHATKFQAELKSVQRWQNLQLVFQLKALSERERAQFRGRDLVLVDDLMTTGATLTAAAKVLAQLQPRSISAVVACRVLK